MNPTPETLQTLSNFLKQTMSPVSKDRNQAEKFLQQHEGNQGFSLLLLNLLGSDSNDPQIYNRHIIIDESEKEYLLVDIIARIILMYIALYYVGWIVSICCQLGSYISHPDHTFLEMVPHIIFHHS